MADLKPTQRPVYEIADMLGCSSYSTCNCPYLQSIISSTCTHVLNMVPESMLDHWKDQIKKIGGKKLKVAKAHTAPYKVIYFTLYMTPQEETKLKMEKEAAERKQQALESKFMEIKLSPMLNAVGATDETAQRAFAARLLNGSLDPLVPFEAYVVLEPPRDKDERRIIDIINKSNDGYAGCVGMCTLGSAVNHMVDLAKRMNKSITDEDKRERRRAACLHYGLKFLANCFTKD